MAEDVNDPIRQATLMDIVATYEKLAAYTPSLEDMRSSSAAGNSS